MSLEVGLAAFKQGRYAEAIELLQAYCQECRDAGTTQSRSYMQAEMGLIKSYQGTQQVEQAIARCQSLLDCDNEALKVWANRFMPTISTAPPPKPAEDAPDKQSAPSDDQLHLLETGLQAQKEGKLDEAIRTLAAYVNQCQSLKSRNYMQAQMALVKAYRDSGQQAQAIAQCQPLVNSENTALSCWASKALSALQSASSTPNADAKAPEESPSSAPSVARSAPPSSLTLTKTAPKTSSYEFSAKSTSASGASSTPSSSRQTTPQRPSAKKTSSVRATPAAGASSQRSRSLGAGGLSLGVLALLFGNRRTRRFVFVVVGVTIGIVRGCLEAGNFDYADTNLGEFTALHEAASIGDVATVQTLMQQGTELNSADEEGNTPLFWAVAGGCYPFDMICTATPEHQQIVEMFLSGGADANAKNAYQETPLHWAAASGNTQSVETLINFGAAINSESTEGYTPLDWATFNDAQEAVKLLQSRGGVVSAPALTE
ncbi:MAG: ankyrin repeat domain-containing protein [Synechococcales bacterium]|nr:ankyrin repeat domain-containing protein [Synechococcales bacterium]